MNMKKRIVPAACLSMLALSLAAGPVMASTSHYFDSSAESSWEQWKQEWEKVAADFTKVAVEPGADETSLNFAWYSLKGDGESSISIESDGAEKTTFTGTAEAVDSSLTEGTEYVSNKVTATGLTSSTQYTYTLTGADGTTREGSIRTGDPEDTKILYVGDPQIGASKGQSQNGEELSEGSGVDNAAARNDAYAWNRTLSVAAGENPDLSFIISAGDQVNNTGNPKEEEYAGYLNAALLSEIPVATTIGNHDSLNEDYEKHFNVPNATEYGMTAAGGDYYYSYGNALFIVLNTNNYNVAEHRQAIEEAVQSDPDAKWRIVTIHQDIYGSGLDHSDTDGMILRTQLTPVFDEADIDVVLQGHDHTYSRSKLLYGDGKTHGSYEFRLNEDGTDYDWDHAYNVDDDTQITLSPDEETDGSEYEAEEETLNAFREDNKCYTIEDVDGNSVTDPEGTLYMTANSASGSKYYELAVTQQDYIQVRSQNWLPSYSVIEITDSTFAITTYQVTDDGNVQLLDDTFTIEKTL